MQKNWPRREDEVENMFIQFPINYLFPCKYLCYIETIITEGKLLDDEEITNRKTC